MIFIIEQAGKPVGAIRIGEKPAVMVISESFFADHPHSTAACTAAIMQRGVGVDPEALQ